MGTLYSRLVHQPIEGLTSIMASRKRRRIDDTQHSSSDAEIAEDELLGTPKKKMLMCTTKYIYQALFLEHRNSDISVHALGKVWHLHKIYLCQSPYFASLFSGAWRESVTDQCANIEILDPQITLAGLETVFGSLYNNEVLIDPKQVISVLATATLFQLDGLIERCGEVMVETIMPETAIIYHDYANEYGLNSVVDAAIKWLLVNLLHYYEPRPEWLRTISIDLMRKLVQHSDLFLMQTEFSLYIMLRNWMYLQLRQDAESDVNGSPATADDDTDASATSLSVAAGDDSDTNSLRETSYKFFTKRPIESGAFLLTESGRPYEMLFKCLRINHLLSHPIDLHVLLLDNIVPRSWLYRPLLEQWNAMLYIDQVFDQGPTQCDKETFLQTCCRCGRYLPADYGLSKWRWTGFSYGLDLLMIIEQRVLSIKRNHRVDHERMLSLQTKRNLIIRVTVCSLNAQRQVTCSQTTDIKAIRLDRNEEMQLIRLEAGMQFPLMVSVNLLLTTPNLVPAGLETTAELNDARAFNILTLGSSNGGPK